MKIGCHCGAIIRDQTDDLPQKGHLIPDQEWFATYDAMDDEVIKPLVAGTLAEGKAFMLSRMVIGRAALLVYQCSICGRLYIDDKDGKLHCYEPMDDSTSKEVLRSRPSDSGA